MASVSTDSPLTRRIVKSFLQFLATGIPAKFFILKVTSKMSKLKPFLPCFSLNWILVVLSTYLFISFYPHNGSCCEESQFWKWSAEVSVSGDEMAICWKEKRRQNFKLRDGLRGENIYGRRGWCYKFSTAMPGFLKLNFYRVWHCHSWLKLSEGSRSCLESSVCNLAFEDGVMVLSWAHPWIRFGLHLQW